MKPVFIVIPVMPVDYSVVAQNISRGIASVLVFTCMQFTVHSDAMECSITYK